MGVVYTLILDASWNMGGFESSKVENSVFRIFCLVEKKKRRQRFFISNQSEMKFKSRATPHLFQNPST